MQTLIFLKKFWEVQGPLHVLEARCLAKNYISDRFLTLKIVKSYEFLGKSYVNKSL